uniref:Uncharacterized protein n=1 Tax=Romanomermis culicivorax TaxID=13658 RepID=A0A915JMB1_ROMCU
MAPDNISRRFRITFQDRYFFPSKLSIMRRIIRRAYGKRTGDALTGHRLLNVGRLLRRVLRINESRVWSVGYRRRLLRVTVGLRILRVVVGAAVVHDESEAEAEKSIKSTAN